MPDWPLFHQYPLACLLLFLFLAGIGLPFPIAAVLIVAGAMAAGGKISTPILFLAAPLVLIPGDILWYALALRLGHRVVNAVCVLSLQRDACIRKTQLTIKRFRLRAFLLGRFLPGFGIVAPPVAGAARQPLVPLLVYDGLGAYLYTTVYLTIGYIFADQLARILPLFSSAGRGATDLFFLALAAYIAYRLFTRYWFAWHLGLTPHAARQLLAASADAHFIDLRSAGDLEQFPYLIAGAKRQTELEVLAILAQAPPSTPIILFCYCPNQATSTDLARRLRRKGYSSAFTLRGGIHAWKAAGFPLEPHSPVTLTTPRTDSAPSMRVNQTAEPVNEAGT